MLPTIITTIINVLIQNLPQIISAGIQLIGALISGLIQAIPVLAAAIPQIVTAIFTTFKNVNWGELGSNIISGIKDGVVNAAKKPCEVQWQMQQKARWMQQKKRWGSTAVTGIPGSSRKADGGWSADRL